MNDLYNNIDLIGVTNRHLWAGDFLERIEYLSRTKVKHILLREKDLSEEAYEELAKNVLSICSRHGKSCILHTYGNAAKRLKASKLHLPLPILRKQAFDPADFSMLGTSVHSVAEAKEAAALGATYLTAGHIFQTACKNGLPPRGLSFLKEVCESVSIPVYAIGGIDMTNIAEVMLQGACGACIMSGFMTGKSLPGDLYNKQ